VYSSGQYHHQLELQKQQQQQQQHDNGDVKDKFASVYFDGDTATESKPDVVYAHILPDPQLADSDEQGQDKVTSSNLTNDDDAVIYTKLQRIDTDNVQPSDALNANADSDSRPQLARPTPTPRPRPRPRT